MMAALGALPGEWAEHPGRPCADPALGSARARAHIFFPETGSGVAEARRLCRGCPVKDECLDYALAANEHYGVWGGASERERRRLRRSWLLRRRSES